MKFIITIKKKIIKENGTIEWFEPYPDIEYTTPEELEREAKDLVFWCLQGYSLTIETEITKNQAINYQ